MRTVFVLSHRIADKSQVWCHFWDSAHEPDAQVSLLLGNHSADILLEFRIHWHATEAFSTNSSRTIETSRKTINRFIKIVEPSVCAQEWDLSTMLTTELSLSLNTYLRKAEKSCQIRWHGVPSMQKTVYKSHDAEGKIDITSYSLSKVLLNQTWYHHQCASQLPFHQIFYFQWPYTWQHMVTWIRVAL
jgi:hypothetical protein